MIFFVKQAYASGCNIVILSPSFDRVQIIPGVCHDNVQISCLDCTSDTGKIAAAYDDQVIIFEPTPLITKENESKTSSKSQKVSSKIPCFLLKFKTILKIMHGNWNRTSEFRESVFKLFFKTDSLNSDVRFLNHVTHKGEP